MKKIQPDEVYHLGSMSHVQISFETPEYTMDVNATGTLRLLEAIRIADLNPCIYNAATSELFGGSSGELLDEKSPMNPKSPYAIGKLCAYHAMKNYREAYNMKIWNGILFNHESPRRGENFITRKITLSIARIRSGKQQRLEVGNIDSRRDWGYAPDYVQSMWAMLQSDKPDDYVIATGEAHSVRDFIEEAFNCIDTEIKWVGSGIKEKGFGKGVSLVEINPIYYRPIDIDYLCGEYSKAKLAFGWKPTVRFKELVKIMVNADLEKEGV